MTSKNLFWTNILDQLKHKVWFFLLCTLSALASGVFVIFLNVYTIENYNYMSAAEIREEIIESLNACVTAYPAILFIGLALLIACVDFSYLHSRKKVDFYHSQPVSEVFRFFSRLGTSLLCMATALGINLIVTVIYLAAKNLLTTNALHLQMYQCFLVFLVGFAMYGIAQVAVILTNNLIMSILFTIGALSYEALALLWLQELADTVCFHVYNATMFGSFHFSSIPLYFINFSRIYVNKDLHSIFAQGDWLMILWILGLTLLAYGLGFFAYHMRRFDKETPSMAFYQIKPFIKLLLVIIMELFIYNLVYKDRSTLIVPIIVGAVSAILLHIILEALFNHNLKEVLKPFNVAATTAGIGICSILLASNVYDWTHYDHYVPKESQVTEAGISFDTTISDKPFGCDAVVYTKDQTGIHTIIELEKQLIANEDHTEKNDYRYHECHFATSTNDQGENPCEYASFYIHYKLKSGKTVKRYFDMDYNEFADIPFKNLLSDPSVIQTVTYPLNHKEFWKEDQYTYLTLSRNCRELAPSTHPKMKGYQKIRRYKKDTYTGLLEALRKDLETATPEQILGLDPHDSSGLLLSFAQYKTPEMYMDEYMESYHFIIYDTYKNTLAYIYGDTYENALAYVHKNKEK